MTEGMKSPRAPVAMPQAVKDAIIAHARAGKPEEICGVVRGRGLVADAAFGGRNIAPERIENYEVDPQTLLLQFTFEDAGDEMMGIYHSHPVSVAYPSATDAWNAHYPECIYFICSLEFAEAPELRAFRLLTHVAELDAAWLRDELPFYETRPYLFAYYQTADAPLPPMLAATLSNVPTPFYIDFMIDERSAIAETRIVSIVEHPIEIEG